MDELKKAREELEKLFGSAAADDGNPDQPAEMPAPPRVQIGHISGGTQHFIGNAGVVNLVAPSHPKVKVVIQPGPEHINDAQKVRLRELVNEVVELETAIKRTPKRHATVWSALTGKLKVTSYHLIPVSAFEQAEAYLQTWCARLRSAKSAPKKDPDWRNSRYRYIHAAAKEIGRQDDLPQLLANRYSGRSLKDLSDLELEAVYRTVAEWKKQARQKGASSSAPQGAGAVAPAAGVAGYEGSQQNFYGQVGQVAGRDIINKGGRHK